MIEQVTESYYALNRPWMTLKGKVFLELRYDLIRRIWKQFIRVDRSWWMKHLTPLHRHYTYVCIWTSKDKVTWQLRKGHNHWMGMSAAVVVWSCVWGVHEPLYVCFECALSRCVWSGGGAESGADGGHVRGPPGGGAWHADPRGAAVHLLWGPNHTSLLSQRELHLHLVI